MALADILKRIDLDAEAEAGALLREAESEAARLRSEAEAQGAAYRASELERLEREANDEARTRLASARLQGRDRILAEKRALIDRALRDAVQRIVDLPDDRYAEFVAAEIARAARGGESVVLGRLDSERLHATLPPALDAQGVKVEITETTGAIDRGVILEGPRMRVEISPAALVESRRTEFEALVSTALFGGDTEA